MEKYAHYVVDSDKRTIQIVRWAMPLNPVLNLENMAIKFRIKRLTEGDIDSAVSKDMSLLTSQLSGKSIILSVGDVQRIARANYLAVADITDGSRRRIIGTACLVFMNLPQGLRLLVESVIVDQDFRQCGVGTALIEALIREASAHGSGHISLTCNHQRADAHVFYNDLGFRKVDTSVLRLPMDPSM